MPGAGEYSDSYYSDDAESVATQRSDEEPEVVPRAIVEVGNAASEEHRAPESHGFAGRIMAFMELEERGRQQALTQFAVAQAKSAGVLSQIMNVAQQAQTRAEIRENFPEAHRLLDAPRLREKQKRRRQKQKTARNATTPKSSGTVPGQPAPKAAASSASGTP